MRPPIPQSYFSLFELPEFLQPNTQQYLTQLEDKYFALLSQAETDLDQCAQINEAYAILNDEYKRAHYLITKQWPQIYADTRVEQQFLQQCFEDNLLLEEGQNLEIIRNKYTNIRNSIYQDLCNAYQQNDATQSCLLLAKLKFTHQILNRP